MTTEISLAYRIVPQPKPDPANPTFGDPLWQAWQALDDQGNFIAGGDTPDEAARGARVFGYVERVEKLP
jgi:hypothetical protein